MASTEEPREQCPDCGGSGECFGCMVDVPHGKCSGRCLTCKGDGSVYGAEACELARIKAKWRRENG